ncbi:MAG: hypothetical protein K6C35_10525 [Eubacterium sp.]|nr:hypothetical protein [Eubacterium sp.]
MRIKRLGSIVLALSMCACLTACGSSDDKSDKKDETTKAPAATEAPVATEAPAAGAETKTSGGWSVEVPAEWEFKIGDFIDENDTRYFSVKKSSFKYFDFSADDDESIKKNYDYNKKTYTNEQTDFKATFGSAEWEGFQYSDGFGGYGFEAFATVGGKLIRVASAGFKYDSEEAKAVLGSLKFDGTAATTEAPTTEAATSEATTAEATTTETTTTETTTTEAPTTEAPTTEAAPVFSKTVEMENAKAGIPEGYTELKDAAPLQYVTKNDATGGKVSYLVKSGTADENVDKIMSGLDAEKKEYDINDNKWVGAISDGFYTFATEIGDKCLVISIDFGATMEEMETLIKGVEIAK